MRPAAKALAAALVLAASSARPGETHPATVPLPPVAPPFATEPALPPYQDRLERLAELMGTLAFMRDLCGDHDGAAWRGRMEALLSAEGTTPARRPPKPSSNEPSAKARRSPPTWRFNLAHHSSAMAQIRRMPHPN